jgi:hypothetical protein
MTTFPSLGTVSIARRIKKNAYFDDYPTFKKNFANAGTVPYPLQGLKILIWEGARSGRGTGAEQKARQTSGGNATGRTGGDQINKESDSCGSRWPIFRSEVFFAPELGAHAD